MKSSRKILGIVLFSILVVGLQNIPQASATEQEGDIGAVIDSLEFNITNAFETNIIQVSGDTFAVSYVDATGDGQIITLTVDSAGDIGDAIVDGPDQIAAGSIVEPQLFHITEDIYGIVFEDGGSITINTFEIISDGTISAIATTGGITSTPITGTSPDIVKLSGAAGETQFYAIGYTTGSAGNILTISITADGVTVATVTAAAELNDPGDKLELIKLVDAGQYAAVYHTGTTAKVEIFSAADDGTGVNLAGNTMNLFNNVIIAAASTFDIRHITGTTYAVSYVGPTNQGIVETIAITNTSVDVATLNNNNGGFTFGGNVINPVFLQSFDNLADLPLIIAFQDGNDNSGDLASLTINAGSGAVSAQVDTIDFDTTLGIEPFIAHRTGNIYVVSYQGPGLDGFVSSFNLGDSGLTTAEITYSDTDRVFGSGDTITITANFNEDMDIANDVNITIDNGLQAVTAMNRNDATTYEYTLVNPAGNIAVATITLSNGTDLDGNVVTATPTGNTGTFEVDNTAPAILTGGISFVSATDLVINFDDNITADNLAVGAITFDDGAPQTADVDVTTIIGNSLSISLTNISGTISSTVTGSLATLTVDNISGQQTVLGATAIPAGDPTPTLDTNTTTATLTDDSFITTIDASASTDEDNVPTVIISGGTTPPQVVTITAPSSIATIELPASTVLTGGNEIQVKVSTVTNPELTGAIEGENVVGTILSLGDPTQTITFNKPVKITLPGLAGNNPFIIAVGSTTAVPIPACGGTTPYADDTAATAGGSLNNDTDECAYDEDNDIIVWSRHFSEFGASTPEAVPTLTSVTISSDNPDTRKARIGDTVTITFDASEPIQTPTITLDGNAADSVNNTAGDTWTGTRVIQDGDTEGVLTFTIDFLDIAENAGTQITTTTDNTTMTVDTTLPEIVSLKMTGPNQITILFSEEIISIPLDYTNLHLDTADEDRSVTVVEGAGTSILVLTFDGAAAALSETAIIDVGVVMRDLAFNNLEPVTEQIIIDAQAPQVVSAQITDDNIITIVFSESVPITFSSFDNLLLTPGGLRDIITVGSPAVATSIIGFSGEPAVLGATGIIDILPSVTDSAGNAIDGVGVAITEGRVLPSIAAPVITTPTDGATLDTTTVIISGTSEADLTIEIFDGVVSLGNTTADTNGDWTFITATLSDGAHSFTATASDGVETSLSSDAVAVTIATVPIAPVITSPTDGTTLSTAIVNISGTSEADATIEVFDNTVSIGNATADSSGNWTFTTGTLPDGAHSFTATASDGTDTSDASAAVSITIDTTTPQTFTAWTQNAIDVRNAKSSAFQALFPIDTVEEINRLLAWAGNPVAQANNASLTSNTYEHFYTSMKRWDERVDLQTAFADASLAADMINLTIWSGNPNVLANTFNVDLLEHQETYILLRIYFLERDDLRNNDVFNGADDGSDPSRLYCFAQNSSDSRLTLHQAFYAANCVV